MSIAAKAILHRAVDILQDQTSVRWPINELIRYLNDAQRIVVKARPDSMNTTRTMTLAVNSRQSLLTASPALTPTPAKLIEITRNLAASSDLTAVTKVERKMMDAGNRAWYKATPEVSIKHFMFDERDPTAFYVYPPAASGAQVEVMYSAYPSDIAELGQEGKTWADVVGDMTIPEIYADDVLNIILAYAYSKDSEYAGNDQRSQTYRAMVTSSLGAEMAATIGVAPKPSMK